MKKLLILTAFVLAASASSGFAQTAGTFGFGVELTGTGALATNNGVVTLYALDNSGGSRLTPLGSSATTSTSWTASSNDVTPTFSLGTFTTSNSLILNGGSLLSYQNSGDSVNTAFLNYRLTSGTVASGSFQPGIGLTTTYFNVNGATGDTRFSNETAGVNLLTGLAPGVYTLDVYGFASANSGSLYESNGGANYAATFTVVPTVAVPEPAAWASMLAGFGMLVVFQRLRSRRIS